MLECMEIVLDHRNEVLYLKLLLGIARNFIMFSMGLYGIMKILQLDEYDDEHIGNYSI